MIDGHRVFPSLNASKLHAQVNNDGILTFNQEAGEFFSGPFPLNYPVRCPSSISPLIKCNILPFLRHPRATLGYRTLLR